MARPKLPHTQLRTHRIVYRLTDAEFLRLSHKADDLNMRLNDYARKLALSHTEPVGKQTRHDPALVKQLYHIGHNLNQITKAVHLGRISPQIEQLCQRIETLMDEAIGKEHD